MKDTQNTTGIDILYRVKYLLQSGAHADALTLAKSMLASMPPDEAVGMRQLIAAISIVYGDATDAPLLNEAPDTEMVLSLRAAAAIKRGDLDAASSVCDHALKMNPDSMGVKNLIKWGMGFSNMSNSGAFSGFKKSDADKIAALREAINCRPALELMRAGKLKDAYVSLKRHPSDGGYVGFGRKIPEWKGSAVRRLLLTSCGGIGDILQFARYINTARERCEHLTIAVPSKMVGLFTKNFTCAEVVSTEFALAALQAADAAAHIDLLICPLQMLGYNNIPYLTAEPTLLPKGRMQVGLCWQSSANGERMGRSASIDDFLPFAELCGVDWHSLVPGIGASWMQIYHPSDYEATARLVAALDLIITVDTGVAHLSGAMGKPTWILLPMNPCWRWETHPTKSNWYPSATLYRRQHGQPWVSLVRKASMDLQRILRVGAQ